MLEAIAARIEGKTYTPADLAQLVAEVKRLENEAAVMQQVTLAGLAVEVARLRQALGFYADPAAWEWQPDPSGGWSGRLAVTDGGARARAALARGAVEV